MGTWTRTICSTTTVVRKWRWRWNITSAQELVLSGVAQGVVVVVRVDLHSSSKVEFTADLVRSHSSSKSRTVGTTGAVGLREGSSTLTDSELNEYRRHQREIPAQALTHFMSQLFRREAKTTETHCLKKPGVS